MKTDYERVIGVTGIRKKRDVNGDLTYPCPYCGDIIGKPDEEGVAYCADYDDCMRQFQMDDEGKLVGIFVNELDFHLSQAKPGKDIEVPKDLRVNNNRSYPAKSRRPKNRRLPQ